MEGFNELGNFFSAALFERFRHGRLRQGFLTGWAVMVVAGLFTVLWVHLYPDTDSDICRTGVAFFIAISLIGALIKTNTDVKDQEEGRYSKMGSGWNLWGDNIWFNKLDQLLITCGIVLMFCGSAYYAVKALAHTADVKPAAAVHQVKTVAHIPTAGATRARGVVSAHHHLHHMHKTN